MAFASHKALPTRLLFSRQAPRLCVFHRLLSQRTLAPWKPQNARFKIATSTYGRVTPITLGLAFIATERMLNPVYCSSDGPPDAAADPSGGDGGPKGESEEAIDNFVDKLGVLVKPFFMQLGFGGVCGFCAGLAMKRIGEEVAYIMGLAFIFLQTLAYFGYIQMNWMKIQGDVCKALDRDGDGQFGWTDFKIWVKKIVTVLVFQMPNCAGFCTGLFYGLKWG